MKYSLVRDLLVLLPQDFVLSKAIKVIFLFTGQSITIHMGLGYFAVFATTIWR